MGLNKKIIHNKEYEKRISYREHLFSNTRGENECFAISLGPNHILLNKFSNLPK